MPRKAAQARVKKPAARSVRSARSQTAVRKAAAPRPKPLRTRESQEARRQRALRILKLLRGAYPGATTALRHRNAYELLVATILSAQCTDERVNKVTPDLFRRYPDPAALAAADPADLEAAIKTTGFFHNKTKSLLGAAKMVRDEFANRVPDEMQQLLELPGVARKTANCVLGTWYHKNEGLVVDTHVGRVALRLGLLTTARDDKDAVKIEQDLMALLPRESWTFVSHALILHGRATCTARKPKCGECPLNADCPSAFKLG
jgi:endonuclease III